MSWREGWRTRGDDLRTFLADFVSFPSQLRRWIKSTYNEPLNKRSSKKYLSLSPHLHGSIATLIQMGGTYVRQRTPLRERADQCG
jgi:hypothetical protein